MLDFFDNLVANLAFIFERLTWLSVIDILLVMAVLFAILLFYVDTSRGMIRGVLLIVALVGLLTSLEVLPAFSWLMRTALPALLFSIPVIFAPEIRHALERWDGREPADLLKRPQHRCRTLLRTSFPRQSAFPIANMAR